MLPRRGQRRADGYTFNRRGMPKNRNPLRGGYVVPYRATSECQASVTQNWNSTHRQINGGRMNGFAKTAPGSMIYWTDEDLPSYYSLARTFTLATRWFSSAPCQRHPIPAPVRRTARRPIHRSRSTAAAITDRATVAGPRPRPDGRFFAEYAGIRLTRPIAVR